MGSLSGALFKSQSWASNSTPVTCCASNTGGGAILIPKTDSNRSDATRARERLISTVYGSVRFYTFRSVRQLGQQAQRIAKPQHAPSPDTQYKCCLGRCPAMQPVGRFFSTSGKPGNPIWKSRESLSGEEPGKPFRSPHTLGAEPSRLGSAVLGNSLGISAPGGRLPTPHRSATTRRA